MTPIQSHVAGLELELSKVDPWSDRAVWLRDLIDQAKSAIAEPISREAVGWLCTHSDGRKRIELPGSVYDQDAGWGASRVPLYTAPPSPDAELVELLRSKFPRIDQCQPVPLDEKAHCCEYTIYVERERLHRLIDAKLASGIGSN